MIVARSIKANLNFISDQKHFKGSTKITQIF